MRPMSADNTPQGEPGPEPEPTERATERAGGQGPQAPLPGAPQPDATPPGAPRPEPEETGRQRLAAGLWPPRFSRAQLIVALLLFVLGLGLAIQVRSNSDSSAPLRGARQEDLVRILDELDGRTKRLEDEKQKLDDQRRELQSSSNQAEEARRQTLERERQLGILAGTVAAQGPGITLKITDAKGQVRSDQLLDTLQELRAAGAEAIQINGVRVVAGSYFSDEGGGVAIDGKKITQPYEFRVIGRPQDLEPALNIPGGVVQTMEKEQATVAVTRSAKIIVDALRAAKQPDYARSSSP
ncbi:DUF881 domain-containing protein [Streptomyces sp. NPDC096136]|uniref:DUF881 domain-containing protein n=1 Tax=Streptomyces sp. NPDC096136 TaxID=3366076 RepID=UPI0037F6D94E